MDSWKRVQNSNLIGNDNLVNEFTNVDTTFVDLLEKYKMIFARSNSVRHKKNYFKKVMVFNYENCMQRLRNTIGYLSIYLSIYSYLSIYLSSYL